MIRARTSRLRNMLFYRSHEEPVVDGVKEGFQVNIDYPSRSASSSFAPAPQLAAPIFWDDNRTMMNGISHRFSPPPLT